MSEPLEPTFEIGQPVVYPQQGLGIIRGIKERQRENGVTKYYEIYLENTEMTLMIPVSSACELGVRPLVTAQEAKKAIESISGKPDLGPADWKLRYQKNVDLMKTGKICNIAKVVQTLYYRSKLKELPIHERKLYDGALTLLIDESSIAMERDKDEISTMILSRLEKK
ncbi:MAG: CarD family transcriptional regulator [Sphaerochaetaceae bacterium]|nr:CarD family transcriptional regulator [Sphaerochaetaceae bacterium]